MALGVSSVVGWSGGSATDFGASGVAGSCFIVLCVPDFVTSFGSDAVLDINHI